MRFERLGDHCDVCDAPQYVTEDGEHHCGEQVRGFRLANTPVVLMGQPVTFLDYDSAAIVRTAAVVSAEDVTEEREDVVPLQVSQVRPADQRGAPKG